MDIDLGDDDDGDDGGGEWMATFADLSTLLLTFFVLLLSFSNMDVVEFREMLGSVRDAFGVQKKVHGTVEAISSSPVELSIDQNEGTGMAPRSDRPDAPDQELFKSIQKYVKAHAMGAAVELELTARGVVVRVKEQVLYESGSAKLSPQSAKLLDEIAEMHKEFADSLTIEGHTDNVPIKSPKYPSNWELSSARAIAALRYLRDKDGISAEQMAVAGYADSKPLDSNDTPEGRDKNRRVEFVFKAARNPSPELAAKTDAPPAEDEAGEDVGKTAKGKGEGAAPGRAFVIPMSTTASRTRSE